jgi:hypothetical protein
MNAIQPGAIDLAVASTLVVLNAGIRPTWDCACSA